MEAPAYRTGKVCYIEIPATDISQSADFYTRVFGWPRPRSADPYFGPRHGRVSSGTSRACVAPRPRGFTGDSATMAGHISGGAVLHEARSELGGFKKFILRGNVAELAVGVVIGAAFGNVVQAVVKDILTPLIGALGGKADASSLSVTLGGITFQIGDLIQALISFTLIALVVYFVVVLPASKLMDRYKPESPPAPTKACPECTSKIPQAARRCPQCAAQLLPPSEEVTSAMRHVAAPSGANIADHAAKVLADRLTGSAGSSAGDSNGRSAAAP